MQNHCFHRLSPIAAADYPPFNQMLSRQPRFINASIRRRRQYDSANPEIFSYATVVLVRLLNGESVRGSLCYRAACCRHGDRTRAGGRSGRRSRSTPSGAGTAASDPQDHDSEGADIKAAHQPGSHAPPAAQERQASKPPAKANGSFPLALRGAGSTREAVAAVAAVTVVMTGVPPGVTVAGAKANLG